MRFLRLTVVWQTAVVFVHAAPAEIFNVTLARELIEEANLRLLARDDPVPGVKWTVHRQSCSERINRDTNQLDPDPKKLEAILSAVEQAKSRAKVAAELLGKWKVDCAGINFPGGENDKIKKQCQLLFDSGQGAGTFPAKCDRAIMYFSAVANIEGPIGKDSSPSYSDSTEWNSLANSQDRSHWRNFVIYCHPQLSAQTVRLYDKDYWWDNAQDRGIDAQKPIEQNALLLMRTEYERGKFNDDRRIYSAITTLSDRVLVDFEKVDGKEVITAERARIPAAITLHPLQLDMLAGNNYGFIPDTDFDNALKNPKGVGIDRPSIDNYVGLVEMLLHEMLHTPGLGKMVDPPNEVDAYGWQAMRRTKNMDAPDFYVYLALV
ncbi:hypothetical protein V8F33_011113 [Rhypophila sp. PSN 637]